MMSEQQFGVGRWLTRDGREAVVRWDMRDDGMSRKFPLLGFVAGTDEVESWNARGEWLTDTDRDLDLVGPWEEPEPAEPAEPEWVAELRAAMDYGLTVQAYADGEGGEWCDWQEGWSFTGPQEHYRLKPMGPAELRRLVVAGVCLATKHAIWRPSGPLGLEGSTADEGWRYADANGDPIEGPAGLVVHGSLDKHLQRRWNEAFRGG